MSTLGKQIRQIKLRTFRKLCSLLHKFRIFYCCKKILHSSFYLQKRFRHTIKIIFFTKSWRLKTYVTVRTPWRHSMTSALAIKMSYVGQMYKKYKYLCVCNRNLQNYDIIRASNKLTMKLSFVTEKNFDTIFFTSPAKTQSHSSADNDWKNL